MPDPGAAGGQQVPDRESGSLFVVREQGQVAGMGGTRHRVDDRHRCLRRDGLTGANRVADDDDAVDSLLQQRTQVVLLASRVAAPVADENQDRSGAERVFCSLHEGDAEPAEAAGGDQADRTGPAGEQAAGKSVRPIAEFLGGAPYPPRGFVADQAAVVKCA